MATRMVWDRGQRLCHFPSGRSEGGDRVGYIRISSVPHIGRRRANKRLDVVGIGGERAIEKAPRLRDMVRGHALIEASQTLKIEVHRVGVRSLFRASRLDGDKLGVQRVRQT